MAKIASRQSRRKAAPAKPARKAAAGGEVRPRPAGKLPGTFMAFITRYPELGEAHESVAQAVDAVGPLDAKTLSLIKIGISIGAGLESAVKSHIRRALQHGATTVEVEQAILLAMNTCGFPRTVAAWSWAQEQFARK